jgi:DNA-binding beta-propeller fold protein YncE
MTTDRMEVKASNPSFYMPCMAPDGSGFLARYDEIDGIVSERVDMEEGLPVRILFSRDGNRGFVLLDSGQIGVFDPFTDQWLSWFLAAGPGIIDITVTPDGTRIVVLGRGREDAPGVDTAGTLWIYDLERGVGAPPEVIAIDSVNPTGEGRILAVSEDSRLLYVRSGKSAVGEVNFATGEYRPLKLNDQFPYSTVRDIQVFDNCLAVLLTLPDESGYVCVCNTQNYLCGLPVPVGRNPVKLDVFTGEDGPLAAALCRSEDGGADVIRFVHLYEQRVVGSISGLTPPGVRDLAVNDLRDDGVILYIPRGGAAGKGYVGFFDRRTLRLRDEYAVVPVDSGSRILLSRSPLVNRCYIWTRRGIISVIDLDTYTRIDKIDLDAESLASPAENT